MILLWVAGAAFALLVAAWVVYPGLMWLAARRRGPRARDAAAPGPAPAVAVVIATRDDPGVVEARVDNLFASDYPAERLRVVVAVDPGSPHAPPAYRERLGSRAEVVAGDLPGGKAATLNAGMRAAGGAEIVVFADAGQQFDPLAIRRMADYLGDPAFGGVTGRYTQSRDDALMVAYADLEAAVRAGQAAGHSVVSTSGSIYAMRPALWRPLPAGLICDDLFTTLSIVRQGRRVGFCADALAFDPRRFTQDQQFVRRVRTLTGLIQYCALEPGALLPWRNPIWPHFVLHKLLRLLTPVLLALGLGALLLFVALEAPLLLLAAAGLALFAALFVRMAMPARATALWRQLRWVVRLQAVPVLALLNGLRGRWSVWTPTESGARPDPIERTP
jgi:cellulose synthase/poly-beta-1,6-N-acetylglucosamine synthase-like glycosyltransferase